MEISGKILGIKNTVNNKYISLEYLIGIILAFSLWGFHLFKTAVISQEIANKCKVSN
jgi:hypothetical protein